MSSFKPPEYWTSKERANYWLERFIKEVDGPVRYRDLFRLPPLVFDTIRDGWEIRVTLKKRFADNPDALVAFIKRKRAPSRLPALLRGFNDGEEEN